MPVVDSGIVIRVAASPDDVAAARELFIEYAEALDYDTCFSGFDREIEEFPGAYAPPSGLLLVAFRDVLAVGAVGLQLTGPGRAEMKRLYVRPTARGCGLGRRLTARLIDEARRLGYLRIELETLDRMTEARSLYQNLGFQIVGVDSDSGIRSMALEPLPEAGD